jgi:hypothetical protein
MNRLLMMILLALVLLGATACQTEDGSREFIPGKGWVPVQ